MKRVEAQVTGTVQGFQRDDETEEAALGRIIFEVEVETLANSVGDPRLHLSPSGHTERILNLRAANQTG